MPSASSPAMASQHPPPRQEGLGQELDLDAFLPSSPTSSAASDADADHRRAVDDLLLLLSSSDSDSEESTPTPSPSTSSRALARVEAPAPPAEPSPLRSPSASSSPSPRRSTSASPSETLSSLVARTFSSNGAFSSSSKPLPSLFRGVRPSPKPGAALAAAAAASRAVLTPHAAAIKSRRSVSAPRRGGAAGARTAAGEAGSPTDRAGGRSPARLRLHRSRHRPVRTPAQSSRWRAPRVRDTARPRAASFIHA